MIKQKLLIATALTRKDEREERGGERRRGESDDTLLVSLGLYGIELRGRKIHI